MKECGVYQIKCNEKVYVGSTTGSFSRRWNEHLSRLRRGVNGNQYLLNAFRKYGKESLHFSILEVVENLESVIEREQYYIDLIHPEYNMCQIAGNC